ncbi:hypothetical protein NMY22_g13201 [Coprinellus aureogranulatus]|nr:hypothetical protein NMY22_g13201 [Coprinellus aureogranulatus]
MVDVEHPFARAFFHKWVSGSALPGQKQLSGSVLDGEARRVVDKMMERVEGWYGTGQCDGWKNILKTSLVASMVNVEYTLYLLGCADISAEAKTAENLLAIVVKEITYILTTLKVVLVAWCTDASGESKKMRRVLRMKYPWLVTIDCWAHQINLVLSNYFKVKGCLISIVNEALEIVKWFNNHSHALGLLRQQQLASGLTRYVSLILPVLTRWTSHYLSVSRLLNLQYHFQCLILNREKRNSLLLAAGAKDDQKKKAEEILHIIEHPDFWDDLKLIQTHLEPLAFATNITQSDSASLDIIEDDSHTTVLKSLEKQWHQADQDVFLLAVILNP